MPDIFDSSTQSTPAQSTDSTVAQSQVDPNRFDEILAQCPRYRHPLNSFMVLPEKTSFNFQLQNEKILLLVRRHPVTQIGWILTAIFLLFVPVIFVYLPFLNFLPNRLQFAALVLWSLLVLGFVLESFLDWFYNVNIVTNERIVDVDFRSLLFKNIATGRLDKIEDVTVIASGYLGAIFDYGNVQIQTAGEINEFEFDDVPHPSQVSAIINGLLEQIDGGGSL